MTEYQPDLASPRDRETGHRDSGFLDALREIFAPGIAIAGDRVFLRQPRRGDWLAWAELRAASRDFLEPWEPTWRDDHLTRRNYLLRLRLQRRDPAMLPLFIFSKPDGALVGGLTVTNIRRGCAQTGTLGYWIGAAHAGQGLMTDAVRALVPHAFDVLELHRLEAACLPENQASRRLLERCRFRREGEAKSYLKIAGQWRDHLLFALTDTDPRP